MAAAAAQGAALPASLQLLNLQLLKQQGQTDEVALQLYSQWREFSPELAEHLKALDMAQGQEGGSDNSAEAAEDSSGGSPAAAAAGAAMALHVRGALFTQDRAAGATAPSISSQAAVDSRAPPAGLRGATAPGNASGLASGASAAVGSTSNATSQGSSSADEVMVRSLLSNGSVLRAARLVRDLHLTCVLPQDLLAAAASTGQVPCFAAVYRAFRESLMPMYPSFEAAQAAYGLAASA